MTANPSKVQRGLSLIELMVAMAIGLVVIGAVLTNHLSNTSTSRRNNAQAQVASDAALALGILRNHIAMAGFSLPSSVDASGKMVLTSIGRGIEGCGGQLMTRTMVSGATQATWTCDTTSTSASDSVLIGYHTDADTSPVTTSGSSTLPMDCQGAGITAISGTTPPLYIAENNFFISTDGGVPSLSCKSSGSTAPLVENIVELHMTVGVADADTSTGKLGPVKLYATAAQANSLSVTPGSSVWDQVKAVRICVVARSAEPVLTAREPYIGCDKSVVTPTSTSDRYIYRAFTTTVVLNNRLATL